jgi:RNA polymerase sigma-70 factor (ECF subfamily)
MFSAVPVISRDPASPECPNRLSEGLVEDRQAIYDELIAPLESRMMRSIWRIVRRPDLAEDTLQDVLAVLWKKLGKVRRHPNPQALVLKICLNASYDTLRRYRHTLRYEEISTLKNPPRSAGPGAADILQARETEMQMIRSITRLPRKQAMAVLMRLVHEESFEAIAAALGCSEITVRFHVSKGRARLREWLAHLKPSAGKEALDDQAQE